MSLGVSWYGLGAVGWATLGVVRLGVVSRPLVGFEEFWCVGVGEFWRRRRVSRYSLSPPGVVFGGLLFVGDWGRALVVGVMVASA